MPFRTLIVFSLLVPILITSSFSAHAAAVLSGPGAVSFPNTTQGVTAAGINLQIRNGGADGAIISSSGIFGANSGDFSVAASPISVGATGSEIWTIDFTPSATGPRSATLDIFYNWVGSGAGDVLLSIPISGTGVGANIVLNPTSHTFPLQQLYTSSSAFIITVTNDGNQTLNIYAVSKGAPADCDHFDVPSVFDTVDPPPAIDSAAISITFSPTTAGVHSCDVTITTNDPDMPAKSFTVDGFGTVPPVPGLGLLGMLVLGGALIATGVSAGIQRADRSSSP